MLKVPRQMLIPEALLRLISFGSMHKSLKRLGVAYPWERFLDGPARQIHDLRSRKADNGSIIDRLIDDVWFDSAMNFR